MGRQQQLPRELIWKREGCCVVMKSWIMQIDDSIPPVFHFQPVNVWIFFFNNRGLNKPNTEKGNIWHDLYHKLRNCRQTSRMARAENGHAASVTVGLNREGDIMGNGESTKWQPGYGLHHSSLPSHGDTHLLCRKMRPSCTSALQLITCICVSKSRQIGPLVIPLWRFLYITAAGDGPVERCDWSRHAYCQSLFVGLQMSRSLYWSLSFSQTDEGWYGQNRSNWWYW